MHPTYDFSGQVVVVTGAARGIGRQIAARFGEFGADLVLADLDSELPALGYETSDGSLLAQSARQISEAGATTLAVSVDVRDESQVAALFESALDRFGRVDVLVNNAGVYIGNVPVTEMTAEQWDVAVDVNLKGPFLCSKYAAKHFKDRDEGGRIITIASTSALIGLANQIGYQSSKTGVIGQVRTLALELAPHRVTVNCVCPTVTESPMLDYIASIRGVYYREEMRRLSGATTIFPGVEAIEPDDVAQAVLWLGSDAARYVTGAAIPVDGGFTMK